MTSIPLAPVLTAAAHPWLGSSLRKDLQLAAVEAAGTGVVALQTRADATASYPLVAFLKAAGIPWVMEGPDGGWRDTVKASGAPGVSPGVVVYGSVLHAAAGDLMLGTFASGMLSAAGCIPQYMGSVEPLQAPWDPAVLTAGLREKMPLGIELVSGDGFAGIVSAYRTEAGVVESFDVLAAHSVISRDAREPLEAAAVGANAQEFGMDLHFGAHGLRIPVGGDGFRVPQLLVLGPSLHEGWADGHAGVDTEILGKAPFQHLAIRYPESASWDGGTARRQQLQALGLTSSV